MIFEFDTIPRATSIIFSIFKYDLKLFKKFVIRKRAKLAVFKNHIIRGGGLTKEIVLISQCLISQLFIFFAIKFFESGT